MTKQSIVLASNQYLPEGSLCSDRPALKRSPETMSEATERLTSDHTETNELPLKLRRGLTTIEAAPAARGTDHH